jgi:hypothetical protein
MGNKITKFLIMLPIMFLFHHYFVKPKISRAHCNKYFIGSIMGQGDLRSKCLACEDKFGGRWDKDSNRCTVWRKPVQLELQHEEITDVDDKSNDTTTMPSCLVKMTPREIEQVSHFVVTLSGRVADNEKAKTGKALFTIKGCIVCHGLEGKGIPALKAPDLTDDEWLYSGRRDDIKRRVQEGSNNAL